MSNASIPDPPPLANGFSPTHTTPTPDAFRKNPLPFSRTDLFLTQNPPRPYANAFDTDNKRKSDINPINCEIKVKKD